MMNKLLIYCFLFFLTSCAKDIDYSDVTTINIDPHLSRETNFSDLFEEVEYIPLIGGRPIGMRSGFRIIDGNFVISTLQPPSCIQSFNRAGELLNSICESGESPGKYSSIRDFVIEKDRSTPITILDRNRMTNYTYTLSGEFVEGYRHLMYVNAMHPLDNRHLAMFSGNELTINKKSLVIWDREKNEIVNEFFEVDPVRRKFLNFIDRNNFLEYRDSLFFLRSFDNTIYHLTKNKVNARTHIDFGSSDLPEEWLNRSYADVQEFMESIRKTEYAFRIIGYFESNSFISFCFEHNGRFKMVFYDKSTSKYIVTHRLNDDIICKGFSMKQVVDYGPLAVTPQGEFVFWVEDLAYSDEHAMEIVNSLEKNNGTKDQLIDNWEQKVNGVILLAKPKRIEGT